MKNFVTIILGGGLFFILLFKMIDNHKKENLNREIDSKNVHLKNLKPLELEVLEVKRSFFLSMILKDIPNDFNKTIIIDSEYSSLELLTNNKQIGEREAICGLHFKLHGNYWKPLEEKMKEDVLVCNILMNLNKSSKEIKQLQKEYREMIRLKFSNLELYEKAYDKYLEKIKIDDKVVDKMMKKILPMLTIKIKFNKKKFDAFIRYDENLKTRFLVLKLKEYNEFSNNRVKIGINSFNDYAGVKRDCFENQLREYRNMSHRMKEVN